MQTQSLTSLPLTTKPSSPEKMDLGQQLNQLYWEKVDEVLLVESFLQIATAANSAVTTV